MSARSDNPPSDPADHPRLLPWYVSGALEKDEAHAVEVHLESCAECREEALALASMKETMLRHGRGDHVPEEDLIGYEDGAVEEPYRRREIEEHLGSCASCRQDLEALAQARATLKKGESESGAVSRRRPRSGPAANPWKWGFFTASALAAGLAVPVVSLWLRSGAPAPASSGTSDRPATAPSAEGRGSAIPAEPQPPETGRSTADVGPIDPLEPDADDLVSATAISLSPPLRGDSPVPHFDGEGPWAITIVFPFGSAEGDYEIHIENENGSIVQGTSASVTIGTEGTATLFLKRLQAAGQCRLVLTPSNGGARRSYSYPFQRTTGSPAKRS